MALLKLTRWRLIAFILCAILPTLLLFHLIQVSFLPFPPFLPLHSPSDSPVQISPTSSHPPAAIESQSTASALNSITNNQATYPRLSLTGSRSEHVRQARFILQRLDSVRDTLFGGSGLNNDMMARLVAHLQRAESDGNYVPPKVVLTSWHWVPCALGTCTTGEVQWIRPLVELMKQHDIIYLFSPWQRFHKDWKLLGNDLITHVWVDDEHVVWCFADPDKCLKTKKNPNGIPPWKLFAFTFWGSKPHSQKWHSKSEPYSFNPLGSEWNLVPYQMPEKQFFLGYHFQGCHSMQPVPFKERRNEVIVLAKRSSYFHRGTVYDSRTFYLDLRNHTGFDIISNADEEPGFPIPQGLHQMGLLSQEHYDHLLSNAKALLGIGEPLISPTPYASLCRGVPVILPYNSKFVHYNNKTCGPRPEPDEWCGFLEESHQHGPASRIGPPYVYAVDISSPRQEILKIIDTAINTPIQPYEPPEMTLEAVEKRLLDYFAIDWESFGEEKVKVLDEDKLALPSFLQDWAKSNKDDSE